MKMINSNIQIANPSELIANVRTTLEFCVYTNVGAPTLTRSIGKMAMENGESLESVGIPFFDLIEHFGFNAA